MVSVCSLEQVGFVFDEAQMRKGGPTNLCSVGKPVGPSLHGNQAYVRATFSPDTP